VRLRYVVGEHRIERAAIEVDEQRTHVLDIFGRAALEVGLVDGDENARALRVELDQLPPMSFQRAVDDFGERINFLAARLALLPAFFAVVERLERPAACVGVECRQESLSLCTVGLHGSAPLVIVSVIIESARLASENGIDDDARERIAHLAAVEFHDVDVLHLPGRILDQRAILDLRLRWQLRPARFALLVDSDVADREPQFRDRDLGKAAQGIAHQRVKAFAGHRELASGADGHGAPRESSVIVMLIATMGVVSPSDLIRCRLTARRRPWAPFRSFTLPPGSSAPHR